jgi:hypothetical protein
MFDQGMERLGDSTGTNSGVELILIIEDIVVCVERSL